MKPRDRGSAMSDTLQMPRTAQSTQGKTPKPLKSRRRALSDVAPSLEEQIMSILNAAKGDPLSIPQIESRLAGQASFDTFDVRDAIWRLIAQQRARFTPR